MNGREEDSERARANAALFDRQDRERARTLVSFVLGSVRRHRLLFMAVLLTIVGGTIGVLLTFPKTYHVEAKTLAQRSSALVVRGDGPGADSLTRVAAETVKRRENLVALVQQTDLLHYMHDHRAPVQRARDAVVKALHLRVASEADQVDGLVDLLEKRLDVWTGESGNTVTIGIDWADAAMACRLVDAAQRAFLDARYAREVTALAEAIDILEGHTASMKAGVDDAVSGIEKMRASRDAPKDDAVGAALASRPRVLVQRAPARPARAADPEAQQMKAELEGKQHAIDELEEARRRRLSELQSQLAEERTRYTESHPSIVNLKQSIAALSIESPQVTSLRQEAVELKVEHDRIGGVGAASELQGPAIGATPTFGNLIASAAGAPPQVPSDVLKLDLDLREDRDPLMVYARGQLRDAMDKYAALRSQIETTAIDLETAKAAFKYRYSVVTPAHLPRGPVKPNVPLVVVAALVAALLCGCLLAVLADVRKGVLLEHWQVERLLGRPVLGEITLPLLEEAHLE